MFMAVPPTGRRYWEHRIVEAAGQIWQEFQIKIVQWIFSENTKFRQKKKKRGPDDAEEKGGAAE